MREFKVDFSEQEAKRVFLNKKIKIAGEEVDFSDAINSSMQHYADEIVNEIINKNGDIIAKADTSDTKEDTDDDNKSDDSKDEKDEAPADAEGYKAEECNNK